MVRFQRTPRYPMGTRVLKHFEGYDQPFGGTVDDFAPSSGFYHIRYDDGDSEEMTEDDVETHFFETSKPKNLKVTKPAAPAATTNKKQKALTLSANDNESPRRKKATVSAPIVIDEDENMADGEEEEDEEEQQGGGEQVGGNNDGVSQLTGQRVCKKKMQSDGTELIVSGTVLSYFPATGMYRVMYSDSTTDDMSYREVVDSIPLSTSGTSGKSKRKSVNNSSDSETKVAIEKKRKVEKPERKMKSPATDENTNNENSVARASSPRTSTGSPGASSPRTKPSLFHEALASVGDSFEWNNARAYEIVRAVLYIMVSTMGKPSEYLHVLQQKKMMAKDALEEFVKRGGLMTLEDRLGAWCQHKQTEVGVLAILKVLAVIPGVSSTAVSKSKIGVTLNNIRKGKDISPDFDPAIQGLAAWVIKKWKKDMGLEEKEKAKKEKTPVTKSLSSSTSAKPKESEGNEDKSSSSAKIFQKRSNSVGHLRDLLGGKKPGARADLLGSALNGRTVSRPLGNPLMRKARRSTVLLDSIAQRVNMNTEAEKVAASAAERTTPEVWTASRVKFGDNSVLEFDKEVEVSVLLLGPPTAISNSFRPRPKPTPAVIPPRDKKPEKSILKVKLGVAEREAIAAETKAEELRNQASQGDDAHIVSISAASFREVNEDVEVKRLARDENQEIVEDDDDSAPPPAPPSPPRKHDESDDENEEETPLPNDMIIDASMLEEPSGSNTSSPRTDSSELVQANEGGGNENQSGENRSDDSSCGHGEVEKPASPIVSPGELSSPESGAILDGETAPSSPLPPPALLDPISPPLPPMTSPSSPPSVVPMPSPPREERVERDSGTQLEVS